MNVVVLRCTNCGTTQATPGECEACHEAIVRPYCGNHEPGRGSQNAGTRSPSTRSRAATSK